MGERTTNFPEVDSSLKRLLISKDNCVGYAAFLVELFRNPSHQDKFLASYSGHVAKLQIDATIANSIMLVCKVWDRKGVSIPVLSSKICSSSARIAEQRKTWRPEWDDRLLGIVSLQQELQTTQRRVQSIRHFRRLHALRLHRTEAIAHPVSGVSRDREKYIARFGEFVPANYWSVVRLLLCSANLIARLQLHWFFEVDMVGDKVRIYREYTRMYWNALPKLGEMEERVRL